MTLGQLGIQDCSCGWWYPGAGVGKLGCQHQDSFRDRVLFFLAGVIARHRLWTISQRPVDRCRGSREQLVPRRNAPPGASPFSCISWRRPESLRTRHIATVSSSTSWGSISIPASPTTSGREATLDTIDRQATDHRFQGRQAKALVEGRMGQHLGGIVRYSKSSLDTRPTKWTVSSNSSSSTTAKASSNNQPLPSGQHQAHISFVGLSELPDCSQQSRHVLARLDGADK